MINTKKLTDDEAATLLGFSPAVHFVEVDKGGRIGFTAGKPDEIRELYARVREAGLTPSRGLIARRRRLR